MIEVEQVAGAIASPHVHAVTLTGFEAAGRKVAACAGQHLKKCVLELGGSDLLIVLHGADMEHTVNTAVASRFMNCGQSCIAAKFFIVVPQIADELLRELKTRVEALKLGDPMDDATQIGPMARLNLCNTLHKQVSDSLGHAYGNILLKEVAGRLAASLCGEDIITRIGGGEFVVALVDIAKHKDTSIVAQKILDSLPLSLMAEGHELQASASIGISIYPDDGDDAETLIKNADIAIYRAKQGEVHDGYCFSRPTWASAPWSGTNCCFTISRN